MGKAHVGCSYYLKEGRSLEEPLTSLADSISCWPHNPWDSVSEVNVEPLTHVAGKNTADVSFCSLSLSASPGASYLLLTVVLLGAQEYSVSAKSHRCPEALRVTKHGCCSSAARLPTPHPSCTQPTGDTRPQLVLGKQRQRQAPLLPMGPLPYFTGNG